MSRRSEGTPNRCFASTGSGKSLSSTGSGKKAVLRLSAGQPARYSERASSMVSKHGRCGFLRRRKNSASLPLAITERGAKQSDRVKAVIQVGQEHNVGSKTMGIDSIPRPEHAPIGRLPCDQPTDPT